MLILTCCGGKDSDSHIILLKNGKVIDSEQMTVTTADVLIVNDSIAEVGKIVDEFALPCCGLMSDLDVTEVIEGSSRLEKKAHEMGVNQNIDPFITLSFLALPVIPEIRLLDTGLFDVTKTEFIK